MSASKAQPQPPVERLRFDRALLPTGWAEDVTLTIDTAGTITSVELGGSASERAEGTEHLPVEHVRGVALPGVPNVHSHAHQRAMAGLAERAGEGPDSFWTWREVMYGFLDRMSPDDLEAIAAQLYVEMLKAGCTAVGEFQYLHHAPDGRPYERLAEMTLRCYQASRQVGIGFTALPVLYAHGDFGGQPPTEGQRRFLNDGERFLRLVTEVESALDGDPDTSLGIAPHSLRAVSPELLTEVLQSHVPGRPVHIHIAEQTKEVHDCLAWIGHRPVEWLLGNFEVDERWCAIHATHMTSAETRGLAQSGAVAGLCPTTEANLGDGIFPASDYLGAGGAISIGSDSQITVSAADDLRILEYGQRLRDRARNVLADGPGLSTGRSLFDRVLGGGARALARALGALAEGHRADILVLDPDHPNLIGRSGDALLDSWIFAAGNAAVRRVLVGGRTVIEDGRHADEAAILERFRTTLERLSG